jgi:hypothetical protein
MLKRILPALTLCLLLTGCAGTFTNLSASRQLRNANNLYPVGVSFYSRQQTLRWDSIKPFVLIGKEAYPLTKTLIAENRWEGLIPVPQDQKEIEYRYKFEFDYNVFGAPPKPDSRVSPTFKLKVLEQ